jgi:hypothetical protein
MKMPLIIVLGAAFAVSACAGRAPAPVAVVQAQDRFLDCAAINAEVQANNKKVIELGGEEGAKVAQNVAAGVAGLFIWPLWFAMDFQGAAPKEIAALQARQQYLATLAEQRCGAVPPLPIQTVPPSGATAAAPSVMPVPSASPAPNQAVTPVAVPAAPGALDGLWLIELKSEGGMEKCPDNYKVPVLFTNRLAEGSWGNLRMTADGDVSGWLKLGGSVGPTTRTGHPANISGRLVNGTIAGYVSGGCVGNFSMSKAVTPAPMPATVAPASVLPTSAAPAYTPTPTGIEPASPQGRELSCINPDGSFLRTTAPSCPPPSTPLQL